MKIVNLTPVSPYCIEFEKASILSYPWKTDLTGCDFSGLVVEGVLVARMAWNKSPKWVQVENVVEIVSLETHYKYRCQGYGQALVSYLRSQFSDRPVVMEINSPFAYQFWRRYNPVNLGRGRGHASLYMLPPYEQEKLASGTTAGV